MGDIYKSSDGVLQNDKTAAKWFQRAATRGDMEAQFKLGMFYVHGRGVAQSDVEAARWFEKAGDQGHAVAQTQLGTLFLRQGQRQVRFHGPVNLNLQVFLPV